jgi:hypothetical protein
VWSQNILARIARTPTFCQPPVPHTPPILVKCLRHWLDPSENTLRKSKSNGFCGFFMVILNLQCKHIGPRAVMYKQLGPAKSAGICKLFCIFRTVPTPEPVSTGCSRRRQTPCLHSRRALSPAAGPLPRQRMSAFVQCL